MSSRKSRRDKIVRVGALTAIAIVRLASKASACGQAGCWCYGNPVPGGAPSAPINAAPPPQVINTPAPVTQPTTMVTPTAPVTQTVMPGTSPGVLPTDVTRMGMDPSLVNAAGQPPPGMPGGPGGPVNPQANGGIDAPEVGRNNAAAAGPHSDSLSLPNNPSDTAAAIGQQQDQLHTMMQSGSGASADDISKVQGNIQILQQHQNDLSNSVQKEK